MNAQVRQGGLTIVGSFVAALMLAVVPLPEWAASFRPDWVALVLIYWCMAVPHRVGIGVAWLAGLLVDVITGSLLGQHALGLVVVAFLALKLHQRIRVYPLWQQALSILVMLTLHRLILLWTNGVIGQPVHPAQYWLPALAGAALWPLVFVLLRHYRRRFKVT